jgi:hypothetical protein
MRSRIRAPALGPGLAFVLISGTALAGPCTEEIAQLAARAGPGPTTGAMATGAPSGPAASREGGGGAMPSPDRRAGTSSDQRLGGTAGTREMNAAVGGDIATSPDDVRRQQQGLPTAAATAEAGRRAESDRAGVEVVPGAQGAAPGSTDSRMALARTELEAARALDAQGDSACNDALGRARQLLQQGG